MAQEDSTDRRAGGAEGVTTLDPTMRADVGLAPEPAGAARTANRPPATSRALWVVTYLLVALLIGLRIPQTYEYLADRVPPDMAEALNDPEMERLALRVGVYLGVVLTALVVAVYFSVAAVLERKVFTVGRTIRGRLSFGLFYLVTTLCMVPVHVVSLVFGIPDPRQSVLYYVYVVAVGIGAPWVYYRTWRRLGAQKIFILFTTSVILATLTIIG
jgi:hypothetical protein